MTNLVTLGEFIIQNQKDFPYAKGQLSRLLSSVRLAAKVVNSQTNKAGLIDDIMGSVGVENVQGEEQKKLDVYAHELFTKSLKARKEVCGIASEEEEGFIAFDTEEGRNASYVVLMDPLDGSSNIDVNVSVGTIFAIYKRVSPVGTVVVDDDFLQRGVHQIAAGYIIYGSSTMLVYSTGNGVNGFTFDPTVGVFYLSHPDMKIPVTGSIYSVNEGNYEHFPEGIKEYISYCKNPRASSDHPYSGRYIGSLVSDFHRNLLKGGIYMYPPTSTALNGKLRLLYECNPLAFLIEQAGGKASNGYERILNIKPSKLHQRVPFYIGSSDMVERLERCLKNKTVSS